jgi:phosphatidate cytidylyltransferase
MLKWRLLLGTLIIGALVGFCILDARADVPAEEPGLPGAFLMPILLAATLLATREVLGLARAAGIRPAAWPIYAGNLLLVVAQWAPEAILYVFHAIQARKGLAFDYYDFIYTAIHSPLWALALGVLMVFMAEMRRFKAPGGALANIAVGVFCLNYIGLMCTFAVQIRIQWGVGALAAWILTVKMGDIGAYTVGRLFGKNKMSPTISPGKTVEGALGALLFALLGSWIGFHGIPGIRIPLFGWIDFHGISLPWITGGTPFNGIVQLAPPYLETLPGTPNGWIVFGLLMGAAGMFGDLAESLLKRDVGVKDSSTWMPGFGGVLDILDSLLLTAPVAWLCWLIGIVGSG